MFLKLNFFQIKISWSFNDSKINNLINHNPKNNILTIRLLFHQQITELRTTDFILLITYFLL